MAAIFSAVWTALTLLLLAPLANFIPKASLAGLLIIVAYSMIEKERLKLTWKSGANSRLVLGGTLLSTLILPLEYAIFVGVFLSIVLLLRVTSSTDLTQLIPSPDSGFEGKDSFTYRASDGPHDSNLAVVNLRVGTPGNIIVEARDQYGVEVAGAEIYIRELALWYATGTNVQLTSGSTYRFKGRVRGITGPEFSVVITEMTN